MAPRIPAEERQLNLVVALMATARGLTKAEILQSVSGYRQKADSASIAALEKQFERDKDDLRRLGVPIETIGNSADPNDLREARYRIPQSEYDLPEVEFTPAELAVLGLAGGVWSEGSLSSEARAGLRKIRALGGDADEPILGFAPRMTATEAAFRPLQQAVDAANEVEFDYLKPGDPAPRRRRVLPLALVDFEARWHVFAWDQEAGGERTFLLSRIVGDVVATTSLFDPDLRKGAGARALAGLEEVERRQRALIEVHPGTEAELRLRRRALPAAQGITVPYVDEAIFADELASYGPEARVVEPPSLRDAVIARLRAALDLHRGTPTDEEATA